MMIHMYVQIDNFCDKQKRFAMRFAIVLEAKLLRKSKNKGHEYSKSSKLRVGIRVTSTQNLAIFKGHEYWRKSA